MNPQHTENGAMRGVRILDMATVLAAPIGATLCADLGAEVVKLELPDGSDALRHMQPVKEGHALWWKVANRGKRGITLDVRSAAGRDVLLSMLPSFDVLVENFRTGTLSRWGLDIETLHRANPRLVVVRLTGFGQTGPYRSRPGFARIFEAMSGFTNLTGEEGGSPLHSNFPIGDAVAGVFCAFSIASEMVRMRGDREAKGSEIDLSATEALFRLLDPLAVEHEQLGLVRRAAGNRTTYTAPSNMYCSADGIYFSLVASSQGTYARLCEAVDRSDLVTDARYTTNPNRVRNMATLDAEFSTWFGAHSFDEISTRLRTHEIPFSRAHTIEDIESDPQFLAREAIIRLPDNDYGTLPAPCIVPRAVGRPMPIPRTGPSVGEHNLEVYAEFGIGPDRLAQLRADKVI